MKTFVIKNKQGTWMYWYEKDESGRTSLLAIKRLE
jgi:hypothetical protein